MAVAEPQGRASPLERMEGGLDRDWRSGPPLQVSLSPRAAELAARAVARRVRHANREVAQRHAR